MYADFEWWFFKFSAFVHPRWQFTWILLQCSEQHISTREILFWEIELTVTELVEYDLGIDSSTGKNDTFQYIPLLRVLDLVCIEQTTLKHIFRPGTAAADSLTDFSDGKIYQENQFFNTSEPRLRI